MESIVELSSFRYETPSRLTVRHHHEVCLRDARNGVYGEDVQELIILLEGIIDNQDKMIENAEEKISELEENSPSYL